MIEELAGIERQGGEAASDGNATGKSAKTSPAKMQGGQACSHGKPAAGTKANRMGAAGKASGKTASSKGILPQQRARPTFKRPAAVGIRMVSVEEVLRAEAALSASAADAEPAPNGTSRIRVQTTQSQIRVHQSSYFALFAKRGYLKTSARQTLKPKVIRHLNATSATEKWCN